jgi:hypothetical protein
MMQQAFTLYPFVSNQIADPVDTGKSDAAIHGGINRSIDPSSMNHSVVDLQLTGSIARSGSYLALSYRLSGSLAEVIMAPSVEHPQRQDNLWQETCFEWFLGIPHADRYWEFNLSPAGHWNVYHFDRYRDGMQPEAAVSGLPMQVQQQSDCVLVRVEADLTAIGLGEQELEVGITAVIRQRGDELSYWALTHPGPEADFHRRDSFVMLV